MGMKPSKQQHPSEAGVDRRQNSSRFSVLGPGLLRLGAMLIIGASIFYLVFLTAQKTLAPAPLTWQLLGGGLLLLGILLVGGLVRLLNQQQTEPPTLPNSEGELVEANGSDSLPVPFLPEALSSPQTEITPPPPAKKRQTVPP